MIEITQEIESEDRFSFRVKKQIPSKEVNKNDEVERLYLVKLVPADEETKASISPITVKGIDSSLFEDYPLKALVELTLKIDKKQQKLPVGETE